MLPEYLRTIIDDEVVAALHFSHLHVQVVVGSLELLNEDGSDGTLITNAIITVSVTKSKEERLFCRDRLENGEAMRSFSGRGFALQGIASPSGPVAPPHGTTSSEAEEEW